MTALKHRLVKGMSAKESKVNFHRLKSPTVNVTAKQMYTATKDKMGTTW